MKTVGSRPVLLGRLPVLPGLLELLSMFTRFFDLGGISYL